MPTRRAVFTFGIDIAPRTRSAPRRSTTQRERTSRLLDQVREVFTRTRVRMRDHSSRVLARMIAARLTPRLLDQLRWMHHARKPTCWPYECRSIARTIPRGFPSGRNLHRRSRASNRCEIRPFQRRSDLFARSPSHLSRSRATHASNRTLKPLNHSLRFCFR
jgi:hypothetical protein